LEDRQVFESWKEIASYLKRSYKTLRRLERDHGLPVHRLEDSPKARVFAYKDEIDRWLQDMQQAGKISKRAVKIRKPSILQIIILAIISAVIVGLFLWHPWSTVEVDWSKPGNPNLAIPYFENNTGEQSLEYLRSGLSEWLIADLSQSRFINVVSGDRILTILQRLNLEEKEKYSSEDLAKIAKYGGANYIVKGNFIKVGDKFVITVMLQNPQTGEVVSSIKQESASEAELASKVDELTRYLKLDLKLTSEQIASDMDKDVGKITTSSPEAYKYYIEGVKYNNLAEVRVALQFLERAVTIDPEFAMAYRIMAACYWQLGDLIKWEESIQRALGLIDRISERERLLIQGHFYTWSQSEKRLDIAIDVFEELLELYPEDYIGNKNLGNIFMILEQWDKAIERFKVPIEDKTEFIWPYANISQVYMANGLYEKAQEVLENYIKNFPDNHVIRQRIALTHYNQGNLNFALSAIDKAASLDPANDVIIMLKGDIFSCKGYMLEAEREYKKLLDLEEPNAHLNYALKLSSLYLLQGKFTESKDLVRQLIQQAQKNGILWGESWGYLYLAYIQAKSGSPEQALESYSKALELWVDIETSEEPEEESLDLYFKGLAYLEMDSMIEAQKTADELEEITKFIMNEKLKRTHYIVLGMIELKKGNYLKAIEFSKQAVSLLPFQYQLNSADTQALYIEPLALSYYMAGDLERCQKEYERITSLTSGRMAWGDIYAKSFYMLGKINEQRGNKDKAIENYEKFLDLWKDADPGIAEVEDAREGLTRLKDQ
jgi:tetratricopeptide (TPR) repeat protein